MRSDVTYHEFEVLAEDLAFPEGPVVMPDGSVILVELLAGRITRIWGQGKREVIAELGGGPNGAQIGPDGALYICNSGGVDSTDSHCGDANALGRIERVDLNTGKFDRLYDHVDGHPLRAPNDLVFDASGGLWFTDMGKTLKRAFDRSGIYYCKPDGSHAHTVHYGGLGYNGIGLSPDGKSLYVACTFSARVYRMRINGAGHVGCAKGPRSTPEEFLGAAVGDAGLDSMAVTQAGNLCVGTLWTGGITTFTPAGETRFLPLPDSFVTNIAFGGEDMADAYITFAATGRLVKIRWDEPGVKLYFN
jgi:gluconolactonase